MNTDSYFHIGRSHLTGGKPCQDYALSGICDEAAFAVVADGCSSGGHTDVGARLLALSTARAIREHWTTTRTILEPTIPLEINVHQRAVLSGARDSLGLDNSDMLATCMYAHVSPDGGFVHLLGDGVVAYQLRSGQIVMYRYEWDLNTPLYAAYTADNYAGFIAAQGGDVDVIKLTNERWQSTPEGPFTQLDTENISLGEGIRGVTIPLPVQDLSCVAVFSDGVTQIDGLDWKDAVKQLLAFKTTMGEFAKRRMIRVIKDAQKVGLGPIDDISYAVIVSEEKGAT